MNISRFNLVDNNIISIFLMLLVTINIRLGKRGKLYTAKIIQLMCWFTIAVLTVDMLAWLVLGIPDVQGWYLAYILNFLLFLLNPTVPVLWLMYTYVNMKKKHLSRKILLIFSMPLI